MPRSGRIRTRRRSGSAPSPLLGLGLALMLLVASPAAAAGYDEGLARRMMAYSSIAISEPEQVEAWRFPNPRES